MEKIYYTALFVISPKELLETFPPKHSKIYACHSTIAFKPESLDGIEVGRNLKIKVLGRAFDDKGDALLIENPKSKNKLPHITISCSPNTDPVYSNELLEKATTDNSIEYFTEPYYINAIEGYETLNKKVVPEQITSFNLNPDNL